MKERDAEMKRVRGRYGEEEERKRDREQSDRAREKDRDWDRDWDRGREKERKREEIAFKGRDRITRVFVNYFFILVFLYLYFI